VPDRPQCRILGEDFVGGDVELDFGWHTACLVGAAVGDPTLGRGMAAPVLSAPEGSRVKNEFYARFLAEPLRYLGEDPLQAFGLLGATVDDGEVEVFGETEGFVVTLAQAGAAF
jgi:hypothetical protein